jgi:hypothetical protein
LLEKNKNMIIKERTLLDLRLNDYTYMAEYKIAKFVPMKHPNEVASLVLAWSVFDIVDIVVVII